MDFRSTPCIFLGYSPIHHGYRCLDPSSNRVYIARHVRFHETVFPCAPVIPNPTPPSPPPPYTTFQPDIPSSIPATEPTQHTATTIPTTPTQPPATPEHTSEPTVPDPSQPSAIPRPRPAHLRQNPKQKTIFDPSANYTTTRSTTGPPTTEPSTFTVANKHPEWRQAMADEYSALVQNGTWSLVPPVTNANIVDCKWIYRIKTDKTGAPARYKARLVAKGFTQEFGIDYHETFSLVVKSRVVLSLAVQHQWNLRQLDFKNAFLHGDLHETIYLRQPPGFVNDTHPEYVCKLHKSLYGLKQAPRAWFARLSTALQKLGFTGSKTDPSLFIYNSRGTLVYFLVYVDDIIVTGNNPAAIDTVVKHLSAELALKDLGDLDFFLGLEIVKHGKDIILSQKRYILELLQRAGLSAAKPVPTPMVTSPPLSLQDSAPFSDPVKYRQLVGALQYLTLSRPDITFAVNRVCQFMHAPTDNHWTAVKRILRYLLGTSHYGLHLQHKSGSMLHAFTDSCWNNLKAFSDADWAGCPVDRRSTGGFAIYLGSNLVSGMARKQKTVSRSSTESEYKAFADTVAELTWLEALLRELGIGQTYPKF